MDTPKTPLLERSEEIAGMDSLFSAVKRGEGGIHVISGGPGVGKSRLQREAAGLAETRGLRTLWASARETDQDLPFGVVRELFGPLLQEKSGPGRSADALFEGAAGLSRSVLTDSVAEGELGGQLYGLYWLLANLSAAQPVCLIVDDLQWTDEFSLRWFVHITERLSGIPVAVLMTMCKGKFGACAVMAELTGQSPDHELRATYAQRGCSEGSR